MLSLFVRAVFAAPTWIAVVCRIVVFVLWCWCCDWPSTVIDDLLETT